MAGSRIGNRLVRRELFGVYSFYAVVPPFPISSLSARVCSIWISTRVNTFPTGSIACGGAHSGSNNKRIKVTYLLSFSFFLSFFFHPPPSSPAVIFLVLSRRQIGHRPNSISDRMCFFGPTRLCFLLFLHDFY